MDNETLRVILGQFVELRKDISAVSSGQEEPKNDVSAAKNNTEDKISAVKRDIEDKVSAVKKDIKDKIHNSISALETKINVGQRELKQEMSDINEELMNDICAIRSSQSEFEERMTCTLDIHLQSETIRVEEQAQELRKETSISVGILTRTYKPRGKALHRLLCATGRPQGRI